MGVNNFTSLPASLRHLTKKSAKGAACIYAQFKTVVWTTFKVAMTMKVSFPYISRVDDVQYKKKIQEHNHNPDNLYY